HLHHLRPGHRKLQRAGESASGRRDPDHQKGGWSLSLRPGEGTFRPMRQLLPALTILLAACGSAGLPGPAMPSPLVSTDREEVAEWVADTERDAPEQIRFRWDFLDENGAAKGRGTAMVFPPDSMRFDFAGPLGSNRSSAAVVGDSALWA